jgi:hypothetical protein
MMMKIGYALILCVLSINAADDQAPASAQTEREIGKIVCQLARRFDNVPALSPCTIKRMLSCALERNSQAPYLSVVQIDPRTNSFHALESHIVSECASPRSPVTPLSRKGGRTILVDMTRHASRRERSDSALDPIPEHLSSGHSSDQDTA